MNIEHLYEEKDIAFWMVPKFIPLLFKNTQTGYLYCLLKAKRSTLTRSNKLKTLNEWFFYPEDWLKNDLRQPNSPNHILKLLKELRECGLIDFKNDKYKPYTRKYIINDEKFVELSKNYKKDIEKLRKEFFEKKQKELASVKTEQLTPILNEDDFDFMGFEKNHAENWVKNRKVYSNCDPI